MTESLSLEEIEALFTGDNNTFHFARWNRPIVPIVFGVDDETLTHLKSSIVTTVGITGNKIEETDPELGANFMWFFVKNGAKFYLYLTFRNLYQTLKTL